MKIIPPILWALVLMPLMDYSQLSAPGAPAAPGENETENKYWFGITSPAPIPSLVNLISSDIESSRIEIITGGFWKETFSNSPKGSECRIYTETSTPLMVRGAPDLFKVTASVVIPDKARMKVRIIEEEFTDLNDISIIPSKGNLSRDVDPDTIAFEYGREYLTDAFFPGATVELRSPHIIRDVRGQTVVFYPFRYNPVRKILRVYTRLVVEIINTGESGENILVRQTDDEKQVRAFEGIYSRNFINYPQYHNASRYIPLEEDGNMLIISYASFMDEMQPFVDWKNNSGIPAEIVDVATTGSTPASIKEYVANYYNTKGLTYLLLVGDAAQVPPSSTAAGISDNDYGYISGNDHYPDIFIGRFSAQTQSQVVTQVQRTLAYEMNPDTSSGYFPRSLCIASSQGPGDDNEYDWQHQRFIRDDYLGYTYSYGAEMYDGSQGGADASGNPNTSMVSGEINTGMGIISYTGHGTANGWSTSGFSSTQVNNLTNNNKFPFILSVACQNGNFVSSTCYAEAWLRATRNGAPTGAVAVIMSTINQSWNPPMCGQDEMVDILAESYPSAIRRTFGGICMNGCMKMNDEYGSDGASMTDTWTIFGDPSLMVRTAVPDLMTLSHTETLPVGTGQLQVNCDREGARIAIASGCELLATGYVSNGSVTLDFEPVCSVDTLTVTATAFNCIPAISEVIFTDTQMTFMSCEAFQSNSSDVAPGESSAEVLGVNLIMAGSINPMSIQYISFTTNGTTSLSDLTGVKVFSTGNSPVFDTLNPFGFSMPAADTMTFQDNHTLVAGANYFWLSFDLASQAVLGNYIDAEFLSILMYDIIITAEMPAGRNPAGAREIELMQLVNINTSQPHVMPVAPGTQSADMIRVDILTEGTPLPLTVNSFHLSTEGTTSLSDISNVKVYWTADSSFHTTSLFGTACPDDTLVVTGQKALAEGMNYFWIAFDVSSQAVPGNELDIDCLAVTILGDTTMQIPFTSDPGGYRIVELNYCLPAHSSGTGMGDYISYVGLSTLSKYSSASTSPYYTFYQDIMTYVAINGNYQLIVSPGTYSSGNIIAAWIDFDRNGLFDNDEKLGEVNVPPMPATKTMNFTVPPDAFIGPVRLRVRETYSITGLSPCTTYNYGETEDYLVYIMKPGCWLGFTNQWNNPANWSDGIIPGPSSQVTIPEIILGNNYPSDFTGGNPVIGKLNMEEGAFLHIPAGVTVTVGQNR